VSGMGHGRPASAERIPAPPWAASLRAITFDFGNTLVLFPRVSGGDALARTAGIVAPMLGADPDAFVAAWNEERDRQFTIDVPLGREADMDVRTVRVVARLRGCVPPPAGADWPQGAAERHSDPAEITAVLDAYADLFARSTPVPPEVGPLLARLATRFRLGLLSNWPLGDALDRYLERAGWAASFAAVTVSQRVGAIKPHAAIFEAAAAGLGVASGPGILHVGDDAGADVAGAAALGWRTALVRSRPADSPLPVAPPSDIRPDLELHSVLDLESALPLHTAPGAS
jgi:HAD superfamily hydrolase (TIGR01509 family)